MNLRAVRRSSLLRTLACTALSLGLSAALSAALAAGDPGQPSVKFSPVAQVPPVAIEVHHGQFESAGKPVEDFYCVPPGPGAHPAVILLHGAVPRGAGNEGFAEMCRKLAAAGYYAMFLEYYSQAGPALPGERQVSGKGFAAWVNGNFPAWMREIVSGIDVLNEDPTIERDRIALMGFSLGGFLALAVGASEGGRVAAIVEYYGGMNNSYTSMAANMPPTLILHGDADTTVPVRYARELDALLTKYNRPHEMKIYPGAWHGLDPASRDDAWRRSMDFLRRYLGR
jgi:carboxymethylenebutenolidase